MSNVINVFQGCRAVLTTTERRISITLAIYSYNKYDTKTLISNIGRGIVMSLKRNRILAACLTCALLTLPATTFAGADSGFYIGAGAGEASVKEGTFDESDSAYKLIAGYNIGFIPFVDFAVEGSYVDFGSPGNTTDGTVDITGFDGFGLVGLNFGPVGIFAKAGAIAWDLKTSNGFSESGTDPAYGIGARFQLFAISIRAEYEVFEFDQADGEMVSVSATFTF